MISIKDVSHSFGTKKVLENISLEVKSGEILGLLGPSGAGKTTLIKILTGQIKQSEGSAQILGEDTRNLSRKTCASLGMVVDNAGLYERLTCYDNLLLFAKIYEIPKERIFEVLEQTGLWEALKRPVSKLSKGMRQRLVIARAILHNPKVLFLDEPTTGLDPATASEIHDLIRKQQEMGTIIFMTTHNMEEAAKLCNHVALLHEGHIVEYGEPEEICRKYNHQNRIMILTGNGEKMSYVNCKDSAEDIYRHFLEDEVKAIHSSEPNLETVFMELTGRGLQ